MTTTITCGQRTFTGAEYDDLQKNKPLMLKDIMATSFGRHRNRGFKARGRKAAAYRSLAICRARKAMVGAPSTQSLLSLKHMDLTDEAREAYLAGFKLQGEVYMEIRRKAAMPINYLG